MEDERGRQEPERGRTNNATASSWEMMTTGVVDRALESPHKVYRLQEKYKP